MSNNNKNLTIMEINGLEDILQRALDYPDTTLTIIITVSILSIGILARFMHTTAFNHNSLIFGEIDRIIQPVVRPEPNSDEDFSETESELETIYPSEETLRNSIYEIFNDLTERITPQIDY